MIRARNYRPDPGATHIIISPEDGGVAAVGPAIAHMGHSPFVQLAAAPGAAHGYSWNLDRLTIRRSAESGSLEQQHTVRMELIQLCQARKPNQRMARFAAIARQRAFQYPPLLV